MFAISCASNRHKILIAGNHDWPLERDREQAEAPTQDAATSKEVEETLDVESLDLTIETVEDRISPSETNVFDK